MPLVRFRAQAMQEAVPAGVGAMAAILGLDDAAVAAACARGARRARSSSRSISTRPAQLVIAGHASAVERAIELAARRKGAKRGVLLPVSAPFHSSLLQPAAERLAARLADVAFAAPAIPVLHNVDVAEHRDAGRDPRGAGAAGGEPGALGRDDPGDSPRAASRTSSNAGPGKVLTGLTRAHRRAALDSVSRSTTAPTSNRRGAALG